MTATRVLLIVFFAGWAGAALALIFGHTTVFFTSLSASGTACVLQLCRIVLLVARRADRAEGGE